MRIRHHGFSTLISTFLLLIFAVSAGLGQSNTTQIALGAQGDDLAGGMTRVPGGYLFCGNTTSYSAGGRDVLFFKTDVSREIIWSMAFGGPADDMATGQAVASDGSYVLTGRTNSFGVGGTDVFFARIEEDGQLTHFKTYGGGADDRSMGIIPTQDDQFLIFGASYSGTVGVQDVLLLKVTAYGDVIWSRIYGGPVSQVSYSAKETPEGNFIVFGHGDSWIDQGSPDIYVWKLDKNGEVIWTSAVGGTNFETVTSRRAGLVSSTGDIYVVGATNSFGVGDYDQFLVKLDSEGNSLWARSMGGAGFDYGRTLVELEDQNILVTGFIENQQNGSRDGLVSKFSPDGDHLWSQAFGSAGMDDIYDLHPLGNNGNLLLMGVTDTYGHGGKDIWIVKASGEGLTPCNQPEVDVSVQPIMLSNRPSGAQRGLLPVEISEIDLDNIMIDENAILAADTICVLTITGSGDSPLPVDFKLVPNSPNPFNTATTINFELPEAEEINLDIYDLNGKLIRSIYSGEHKAAGYHSVVWSGDNNEGQLLSSGIYICRLSSASHSDEQELVLLK